MFPLRAGILLTPQVLKNRSKAERSESIVNRPIA